MSYTKTQWNNDTAPAINETNLNKIEQGIYDNDSHIGDLSDLETTTNTDLVSAINENVDNIGDLTTLTTTANTDLVSAINEVDNNTNTNTSSINNLEDMTNGVKPMGDVVVDSIRSKNMFNKNTIILSHYVNKDTGNLVYSASNNSSNFIKISGQYIVVSGGYDGDTYALYNSSKTYLSGGTYTNGTAIDVTNASYIRITVKPAVIDTFQLEYGTTSTTYKPHQELDNQDVYSTTETKVGTWIDGKPLYRKVVYISSLPNNTMTTYQVFNDKSIIDTCFIDSSGSYMKIGQEVDTLNWIYSTTGFVMTCLVNKEIRIKTTDDKNTAHAYIAVCYTKTTD